MSLRIWFFPLMMLVSIVVFFAVAYPDIKVARGLYGEKEILEKNLALINEKKENIQRLDQSIGENKSKEDFMKKYFPGKRFEEKIINSANSLALQYLLIVNNMSIKGDASTSLSESDGAENMSSNPFVSGGAQTAPASAPATETKKMEKLADIQNLRKTTLEITLSGKYSDIKSFISSIGKVEMLNDITSVSIKSKDKDEADQAQAQAQPQGEEQAQEEAQSQEGEPILIAKISVDFYHTKIIRSANYLSEDIFSSSKEKIDFSKVDYISNYAQSRTSDLEVIERSKSNPFQ